MSENYYAKGDASSAGAVLAAAREESNLSVAEVARHLKLSPAQVEALEEGAYDRLPGRVFVRGFLRNYAKLLGIDPQPLLSRMDNEMPQPTFVEEPPRSPHEVMPTGERSRWTVYIGVAGVIVVALAAYEFGFNAPPPSRTDTEAASPETSAAGPADTAASSPAAAVAAPDASANPAESSANPAGPDASALSAAPTTATAAAEGTPQAAAPAAAETSATAKAPDAHELQFRFDEEAWVEVRDANDKAILRKLSRAGSEERVTGMPPFKLVVGNARSVHITYDGDAVDLGPHIGATVARLTLK
jgi:cytoskeleton protein RodZ